MDRAVMGVWIAVYSVERAAVPGGRQPISMNFAGA